MSIKKGLLMDDKKSKELADSVLNVNKEMEANIKLLNEIKSEIIDKKELVASENVKLDNIKKQYTEKEKSIVEINKEIEKIVSKQEKEKAELDKMVAIRIANADKEEKLKIFENDLKAKYKKSGMEYPE